MAMAIWFYLPSDGGVQLNGLPQSIFNFGLNGVDDLLRASRVGIFSGGGQWSIQAHLFGGGVVNPFPPPAYFGMNNQWISNGMATIGSQTHDFWHCLAMSWDGSQGVGGQFQKLSANPVFSVALDDTMISGTSSASSPANTAIYDATRTSDGLYIQGFPMGIPVTEDQQQYPLQFTETIIFHECQIWFNKYVDWSSSTNRSKVMIFQDGRVRPPADVRAAQDAFGSSDIWFLRDGPSGIKYENNQGTAGPFTVVGTNPQDFSPGP
jgi:hypothetical protein